MPTDEDRAFVEKVRTIGHIQGYKPGATRKKMGPSGQSVRVRRGTQPRMTNGSSASARNGRSDGTHG